MQSPMAVLRVWAPSHCLAMEFDIMQAKELQAVPW